MTVSGLEFAELRTILRSDDQMRCQSYLHTVEAEIRKQLSIGKSGDSARFDDIAAALMECSSTTAAGLRVELLLLLIQKHFTDGTAEKGLPLAQRALSIAKSANTPALERKALNNLGILHLEEKNIADATVCFVRALQIADRLGDRVGKVATLSNLAGARFSAGLLDESIKLYRYVANLAANDCVLQQLRADADHNIALASLALDDLAVAERHITSALSWAIEPQTTFMACQRVVMELTATKIFVALSNLTQARARCDTSHAYAARAQSRLATLQAELASALCESAEGKHDIALSRLQRLKEEIKPTEMGYGDLLEIELACSRLGKQQGYARLYTRRYLSHLAEWQRRSAAEQFSRIKKVIGGTSDFIGPPTTAIAATRYVGLPSASGDVYQELESLAIVASLREDSSGERCFRVGRVARRLALALGMNEADAAQLEYAVRLQDIGKLAIPDAVLLKRGKLSAAESEIARRHTIEGCVVLADLVSTLEMSHSRVNRQRIGFLRLAAEVALHHHERFDGSGYPRGIAECAIPLSARIAAVADSLDALTHVRPYKRPRSSEAAVNEVLALSGRQFDTEVCKALMNVAIDVQAILSTGNTETREEDEAPSQFVAANRIIQDIVKSTASELHFA